MGRAAALALGCWLSWARSAAGSYTTNGVGDCSCSGGELAAHTYTFLGDGASDMESTCSTYCDNWSNCAAYFYRGIHPTHTGDSSWDTDKHANICYLYFSVGNRDTIPTGSNNFVGLEERGGITNRGSGYFSNAAFLNTNCLASVGATVAGTGIASGCKIKSS